VVVIHSVTHRTFCEHWTDSGEVVVLDGNPETLGRIAEGLSLPATLVVPVTSRRALLALWGDVSSRYLGRLRTGKQYADRYRSIAVSFHYLPIKSADEVCNDGET
jgi:hypothetical protein